MADGTADRQAATERAILALRRLNSALAASNRAVGAALGIKDGDLAVLNTLNQEGPRTPTELAHRTRTHLATMTGILARLERDDWIERRRDEVDHRSVQIHATGVHRLTDVYARANDRLGDLLESWAPGQLEMLVAFLVGAGDIADEFAEQVGVASTGSVRPSGVAPQDEVPAGVHTVRGGDRLGREELHERAVR